MPQQQPGGGGNEGAQRDAAREALRALDQQLADLAGEPPPRPPRVGDAAWRADSASACECQTGPAPSVIPYRNIFCWLWDSTGILSLSNGSWACSLQGFRFHSAHGYGEAVRLPLGSAC